MIDIVRAVLGGIAPEWLITLIAYLIIVTIVMVAAPLTMMMQVWFERRVVARMQDRLGPNRVGPAGLLQSVADGVKMFTKEDIVPRAADRWVHLLAPIVALTPVMLMFAVIPWARGAVPTEVNIAALFVVAITSVSAVGLMMAGWGSNNKFALLGAMRAVAQMVSYEIPAVIMLVSMVLLNGSMSLTRMIEAQAGLPVVGTLLGGPDLGLGWYVFTPVGLLGFVVFFICVLSEGERTPFDIPEADSEIVAGYMTEYSGMKFALFYIAQFVLNFALSMVTAIVFLGGWQGPGVAWLVGMGGIWETVGGVLSLFYTLLKAWFLFFVMIWLRGAFPRLRVDQLMGFAWKFLLPLALVNILSAALWVVLNGWGVDQGLPPQLAELSPLVRLLLAFAVTLVINAAAFLAFAQINRPTADLPRQTGSVPA
ncbi:MAG: NADH-quinone oxidoreductase subunit NuoH [Roseiflexaceae bacterium]